MRLDTFVWAAILDSLHPHIGSATGLPDTKVDKVSIVPVEILQSV